VIVRPLLPGDHVGEFLARAVAHESGLLLLFDPSAAHLPEHVEVVLNDRLLDLQGGLDAELHPGDVLSFLPAHAGGL
jgi:molybdopterin converting factor small subunit